MSDRLTPEREAEIVRFRDDCHPVTGVLAAARVHDALSALLAELAAVRAERDQALDDLTGANLARWEEEQDNARLRLALKSAQRGRRQARARVAELEAGAVAEDPNDRRRRIYIDGKGDGWIDSGVDTETGERDVAGITNPWKVASAEDVKADSGSLREIGRCW